MVHRLYHRLGLFIMVLNVVMIVVLIHMIVKVCGILVDGVDHMILIDGVRLDIIENNISGI